MDFYISPLFSTFALFGTAVHNLIEMQKDKLAEIGVADDYCIEERRTIEFNGINLTGRVDQYNKKTKTLFDYKTIKSYAVEKMKKEHFEDNSYLLQLNGYRTFFFPEAEHLIIEAFVKDWGYDKYKKNGVMPIEKVEIPILSDEYVKETFKRLIDQHLKVEKSGQLPDCTKDEVWFNENPKSDNFGIPLRCRDYCEVNSICDQYRRFLSEADHDQKRRVYPNG